MKHIFLYGDHFSNTGPGNVNRSLIAGNDGTLLYFSHAGKFAKLMELLLKVPRSEAVLISGCCSVKMQKLLRSLNPKAKILYLIHGNLRFENQINHMNLAEKYLQEEEYMFSHADRIVCVSERYAHWLGGQYPQYKDKLRVLNNIMEVTPREEAEKWPYTIAVSGSNRRIKNNLEVCKAVQKLQEKGIFCKIYVFGYYYEDNADFSQFSFVDIKGQCDKETYYSILDHVNLFVINSELESFGLSAGDALNCRCSLLLSDNVGVGSLFHLEEADRIHDPHDIDELSEKIHYLLEHPNAKRILSSFDGDACSEKEVFETLKDICFK